MRTANDRIIGKEQFYTHVTIARDIVSKQSKSDLWHRIDLVVEPSCGNGAFTSAISDKPVIGFDIEPRITGPNIFTQDFLGDGVQQHITAPRDRVLCIGNPPFGRALDLVRKFINKCAQFSDNIVMIVPISVITSATGMNGFNKNIHIKSSDRLDGCNVWTDENGILIKRKIKTASVHFEVRSYQRPKVVKEVGGATWQFVKRSCRIEKNDLAVFHYSTKVEFARLDVKRNRNHIIRFNWPLTLAHVELLRDKLNEWRKYAQNDATTGMCSLTQPQLSKIINSTFS